MRNSTRWAAVAALLLLAPACGDDDDASDGAATDDTEASSEDGSGGDDACAGSGSDASVTMVDFAFDPSDVSVASGGVVEVANEDGVDHTFTSADGGFDCTVAGGETANVVVSAAAGEYEFHCTIHPAMTGTITVE
jgi:plastocyanin